MAARPTADSIKLLSSFSQNCLGQGTLPAKLSISHAHGTGRYRGNDRRANFDCVKVFIKSPRSQKNVLHLRWLSPLYSVQYDELVVRARINTSSYSYS